VSTLCYSKNTYDTKHASQEMQSHNPIEHTSKKKIQHTKSFNPNYNSMQQILYSHFSVPGFESSKGMK